MKPVQCGPDCPCDTPKTGISIGKMDSFGTPYPEAVSVVLDKRSGEWVVYARFAAGEPWLREVGRHPGSQVEVIRYLPNEVSMYSHPVADSGTMLSPDCRDGKHAACNGNGWDIARDEFAQCPCPCHVRPR